MSKSENAKRKISVFIEKINPLILSYWQKELSKSFGFNDKQKNLVKKMIEHSQEHSLRSAKRLRGAFTYYGYLLSSKKEDSRIWDAAIGVELVHTALLMHDDFMDQDLVRRGKPTTQRYFATDSGAHYGDSMAVTVGDAVLCIGFDLLNSCGFEPEKVQKATAKMLRGIAETAFGQAYDVSLEKIMGDWKEDDVIAVHKAKTSIYTYENPLFIGAHLAGAPNEILPILHSYSMDGGVAFQLQDDILGIFGDTEKTGKSSDSDLLQGKCTLLVMRVLSHGSEKQKQDLLKVWGKRSAQRDDIELAKKSIIESGSLDYSKRISREYAQRAVHAASKLRSHDLNIESIEFLEGIAEYMIEREL